MVTLHSDDSSLRELAQFVSKGEGEGDKTFGSAVTDKVGKIFGELLKTKPTYVSNRSKLEIMRQDAIRLKEKILELTGSQEAWNKIEIQQGLHMTLRQNLESLTKLLSAKIPLLDDEEQFYHQDLLKKSLEEFVKTNVGEVPDNPRALIRGTVENMLKRAMVKDLKPHYLLRDPSSMPQAAKGTELLTLSFISQDGSIKHQLLTYIEDKKIWVDVESKNYSTNLSSLVTSIVGKESRGISSS